MSEPRIYPAIKYRDPRAAIEWLKEALGFQEHVVHVDAQGGIAHAELRLGEGIVMVEARKAPASPLDLALGPSPGPQVTYVAVDGVDGYYQRAVARGTAMVMEIADLPYGSRDFICRDPEGHIWCFGTYRPKP